MVGLSLSPEDPYVMVVSEYLAHGQALVMDGKQSPIQWARCFDLEPGNVSFTTSMKSRTIGAIASCRGLATVWILMEGDSTFTVSQRIWLPMA